MRPGEVATPTPATASRGGIIVLSKDDVIGGEKILSDRTTGAPKAAGRFRKDVLVYLLIAASIFFIYGQVVHHPFVDYDDPLYVTNNPNVQDGLSTSAILWAFTSSHAANWHPLTWVSHMVDCQLFGVGADDAGGHHLVNVLLHTAASILLFLAIKRMTAQWWPSALVAMLFAVHPLRVESVAWVSERKDVLSGVFFILTLWAYAWYVEKKSTSRFRLVILSFAMGLLAKPMLVTVPCVLLLLDLWPLERLSWGAQNQTLRETLFSSEFVRLIREKSPLFILSGVSCLVTFVVQRAGGAVHRLDTISPVWRAINAAVAYVQYLGNSVWPTKLAIFYPHPASNPDQSFAGWLVAGVLAAMLLAIVTLLVLRVVHRWSFLAVGWFWYLGMMIPVIGLVQVGMQSHADRYTYLPLIGIYLMVAWSLVRLMALFPKTKIAVHVVVACILLALTLQARFQASLWKDDQTLFARALAVTNNNFIAHLKLGKIVESQGQLDQALVHYEQAVRHYPDFADAYASWGGVLHASGRSEEAIPKLEAALRINPKFVAAHRNYGHVLMELGRSEEALDHYKTALWHEPDDALNHMYCGNVLLDLNRPGEAMGHFQLTVQLAPDNAGAYNNWARALIMQGRLQEAVLHLRKAHRMQPDNRVIGENLRTIEAHLFEGGQSP